MIYRTVLKNGTVIRTQLNHPLAKLFHERTIDVYIYLNNLEILENDNKSSNYEKNINNLRFLKF